MIRTNTTFLFIVFFVLSYVVRAQVTFTEHIAPIIYNNCTECHRNGEIGPMALTNYEEVKNWGEMIKYVTNIKYMPPWKPEKKFSSFLGERGLSEAEISLIADWVEDGMLEGDRDIEPEKPQFPEGSQVGEPDLVLSFSRSYTHKGNNQDQYQVFVLPTGLTEDKVLKAIELRPGNRRIVHHALFASDVSGEARMLDEQTPEYGYANFGDFGVDQSDNYPGYVPGSKARVYPEAVGQKLLAGSDLLVQMHYAPISADEKDSSSINLFFADEQEAVNRFVKFEVMLPFGSTLTNGPFFIQANRVKRFHGVWKVPNKISMIGIAPHMHLLGREWEVYAVSPQGDTTNLIQIPDWDFNWQGFYYFPKYQVIESGSTIHAFATYDNTTENPFNPNNPPVWVTWGEGTEDEMYYLPFAYLDYRAGDENVVFEDAVISSNENNKLQFPENKLFNIYPSPAKENITVGFSLASASHISVEIVDINGKVLRREMDHDYYLAGRHQLRASVQGLISGIHFVKIIGEDFVLTKQFSVVK